jgi:hypothetical protein
MKPLQRKLKAARKRYWRLCRLYAADRSNKQIRATLKHTAERFGWLLTLNMDRRPS